MTPETITIIIPVYNVQDYIRECLDSVAKQTYGGALECIIVDDCGSDNSIAITETFIQEYLRTNKTRDFLLPVIQEYEKQRASIYYSLTVTIKFLRIVFLPS